MDASQLKGIEDEEPAGRVMILEGAKHAAQEATMARSFILANISHELRTPLNGILGTADLLDMTPLSGEQMESLSMIRECGESLLKAIDDILDFVQIATGRVNLDAGVLNLHRIYSEIVPEFASQAQANGVRFIAHLPSSLPTDAAGSSGRIAQVVRNLLSNAVKFTPSGEVRLSVDLVTPTEDGYELELSVSDTGIGIEKEHLTEIFEAFAQADTSYSRPFAGIGLGLSTTRELVRLMNGSLSVESTPGVGSRFRVVLPLGKCDQSALRDAA